MCKYKEFLQTINKDELASYYRTHLPKDTILKFKLPSHYVLNHVLNGFNINRLTPSEITTLQMSSMTPEERKIRGEKIGRSNIGRQVSEKTRLQIASAQKGKSHKYKSKETYEKACSTRFKKGQKAYNKGVTGVVKQSEETITKRFNSMRLHNTFNKSKSEDKMYQKLCEQYGASDVIRQYYDKTRYPFHCDFYIKSKDLFIELNAH